MVSVLISFIASCHDSAYASRRISVEAASHYRFGFVMYSEDFSSAEAGAH
jgi:hypothetical protein